MASQTSTHQVVAIVREIAARTGARPASIGVPSDVEHDVAAVGARFADGRLA